VEQQYNRQLEKAKQEIQQYDRELKEKIRALTMQQANDEDVTRITTPIERALRRARITYQGLVARRGDVEAAARNEQTLFGVGGIRSRPRTPII
jgi:hypothetical protein